MISKSREIKRGRSSRIPKNVERLLKDKKCRECSVVVTRMDFAKILGKFTKVKIQYESSTTSKVKGNAQASSPNTNARLKNNENGMVLIHRKAYNPHPVKELLSPKKAKVNTPTPRVASNILKENNRLKRTPHINNSSSILRKELIKPNIKYGIIFENPTTNNNHDLKNKISLPDLLPVIDQIILPAEDWCIDYFPKCEEPKEDKVYDRIAAELEDLMYNEKPVEKIEEKAAEKVDDFPSIMDILNDNTAVKSKTDCFKPNLESSDVEAMLLGKSNENTKVSELTNMDVDNTDERNVMDVEQCNITDNSKSKENDNKAEEPNESNDFDNPHSPSILDEALQKGIEEHLPIESEKVESKNTDIVDAKVYDESTLKKETNVNNNTSILNVEKVTHVVFKKNKNGKCYKSVMCPNNLKYSIELEGKSVEFIGAPKFISSLEDLQVLLQIVNESELDSLYVLH